MENHHYNNGFRYDFLSTEQMSISSTGNTNRGNPHGSRISKQRDESKNNISKNLRKYHERKEIIEYILIPYYNKFPNRNNITFKRKKKIASLLYGKDIYEVDINILKSNYKDLSQLNVEILG